MRRRFPNLVAAAVNVAVLIPAMVAGVIAAVACLFAMNSLLPRPGGLPLGIAGNVLPPLLAGFLMYFAVASTMVHRELAPTRHWLRALPMYLFVVALSVFIARNWHSEGFGLVAQLFVWPAFAITGGIAGEAIGATRGRAAIVRRNTRPTQS